MYVVNTMTGNARYFNNKALGEKLTLKPSAFCFRFLVAQLSANYQLPPKKSYGGKSIVLFPSIMIIPHM